MAAERTSEGDKLRIEAQTALTKVKNGAKNWPFSHFSKFITTKATRIAASEVISSLLMIRPRLKLRLPCPNLPSFYMRLWLTSICSIGFIMGMPTDAIHK